MTTNALYYTTHASSIGTLLLVGSPRGLRYLTLVENDAETAIALAPFPGAARLDGFFESTARAIDAYLAGGETLAVPYDLAGGTPLQRAVWLAMAKIPYGKTVSYSQLAENVGFPRAIRAVASACGANPLPLVIPCHRVVAKDGTLGGFSLGGLGVKEKLLAAEAASKAVAA